VFEFFLVYRLRKTEILNSQSQKILVDMRWPASQNYLNFFSDTYINMGWATIPFQKWNSYK
jgi:hypothetical protein